MPDFRSTGMPRVVDYSRDFRELANRYSGSVHAHQVASVDAEPEAQLTTPVTQLFQDTADLVNLPPLRLIRETRLENTRPDFSAISGRRFCGWIELKRPDLELDPAHWIGHNARQWRELSHLDNLILCNGRHVALYSMGSLVLGDALLPYDQVEGWDPGPLIEILRRFALNRPQPIISIADLAKKLAYRTIDLRESILNLLSEPGASGEAARRAFDSWKSLVHPLSSETDFGDSVAQVIAYGMVLAVLTQNPQRNEDGIVTVRNARDAIRESSPVMAAAFGLLLDNANLREAVSVRLYALENLVSNIDVERVNRSSDERGEPWLFFYEDFLAEYDPDEKRKTGVYFTPIPVVKCMVSMVQYLLRYRMRVRLGFADRSVVTLDPAVGTGTFPLEVLDTASERARQERGAAGPSQISSTLADNLYAFELLPGPYSVAHLRLEQRFRLMNPGLNRSPQVMLTDTLESPNDNDAPPALFGDPDVLAQEQARANRFKTEHPVTVVIGNPPYRRVSSNLRGRGSGAWLLSGHVPGREPGHSLFDDILDVARANTAFSHIASLYNLYVYFWRWSLWKAFEAHDDGPGIVALITGSSWLSGPGFIGLRQMIRQTCDEVWVIDLGGDNRGANPEENIFAIETPVAITICVRDCTTNTSTLAPVHYRRYRGTKEEKLEVLRALASSEMPFDGEWTDASNGILDRFIPETGDMDWYSYPALADLFPWQQPGCMFNRTWPIAPDRETLVRRWNRLVSAPAAEKPTLFFTPPTGRNTSTRIPGLQPLANLSAESPAGHIVRYAYHSFDIQFTFEDPRLIALERPSLWQSRSGSQIFLATLMTGVVGPGPALTVSCDVPDKHYFRGSVGGKDIIPLYRDAECMFPNITQGLLGRLGELLQITAPSPEDLLCYVYAMLSSPLYQEKYGHALETPGPRVPLSKEAALWEAAVLRGRYLLWMHTYGRRFSDGEPFPPSVESIGWTRAVSNIPQSINDIEYDRGGVRQCGVRRVAHPGT